MRFLLTMNMPVRSGAQIHQITCEYKNAKSLQDFVNVLTENDFVVVEEFYKDNHSSNYYSVGEIALNHNVIGKIRTIPESGQMYNHRD